MRSMQTSVQAPPLSVLLLSTARNLQAVLSGRSLTDALAAVPAVQRPAVQALSFQVMRGLGRARALREALVPRPPTQPLLDALLLVSLALLDASTAPEADTETGARRRAVSRYAPHTLVDQAVRAVSSQHRLQGAKGLVNAVLRRYLRERDVLVAALPDMGEARWNHPDWWIARLAEAYPDTWQALLAGADTPPALTLRVNPRRASREEVARALDEAGVAAVPVHAHGLVLETPRPVAQLPGYAEGWWSVQDAGAQVAAPLLDAQDGWRVLDACAAPGGKTAHLLEGARVELLALDADADRLARVGENLARLGLSGPDVTLVAADAADLDAWWDGRPFDAVLADVPCTASGIVRRHPDIRWLRRPDDLPRTAALQARIADALWRTVKPGGRLLYVTCSIFPEEGESQAQAFAGRHGDAERLPAPGQILPSGAAAPLSDQHDGFFYALFAKCA
ncbi:Ribosomal RNA small subunit methyltransferase B [plant metagenome]|uniref:Ribosomal RNA small subunit methyltransferase B n=1 Tax=plant metagenome TaxID=1297885 RepID=A0A484TUY1_9ZZZZ